MATASAMAPSLFLGSWRVSWPYSILDGANSDYWPLLSFFLIVVVRLFIFIWLRGTLPRLRYDQFMSFGWKVLVPTALVWILAVATMRTVSREADLSTGEVAVYVGLPLALLVLAGLWLAGRSANKAARTEAQAATAGETHIDEAEPEVLPPAGARRRPTGGPVRAEGGFPVPPMDLKVPPSPRLRSSAPGTTTDGAVVSTGRRGATATALADEQRADEENRDV